MGFIKEFKDFAVKGNMVEMAIGIIIGAAFKDVVDVIVKKIILPPLTILTDGINFAERRIILRDAFIDNSGKKIAEVAIGYGELIEVGLNFLIISFVIFLVVKLTNRIKEKGDDEKDSSVKTPRNIELMVRMNQLLEEQNKLLTNNTSKK